MAGGVARASHPAARRRPRNTAGTTRSTRRAASCSTRPTAARSTCIRCTWCDGYPCLVHAKSDAETIAVRPVLELPECDAPRRRRGDAARDRRVRPRRSPTSSSTRGGNEEQYTRRRGRGGGRRREQRQDPPPLGDRPASERPGQRLRPGGPELHVPQQQGSRRAVEGAQRDGLPEDPGDQRLLPRRRRLRLAGRQHPDGRQVERGGDEGRGTQAHEAGAALEPFRHRRACRRLLAHHRRPPQAREPRHARRRRQRPPRLPLDQRRRGRPALPRAEADPEPRRDGATPRARQELLHGHEHPGRRRARTRPAPSGSAPTRRPPCSTSTARPTSSTTCTWSTRASSPASVP